MPGSVVEITDENFQKEVLEAGETVLLDFHATWCGPCKTIAPIVEELAESYAEKGLKVGKVDIDVAPEVASRYSVQGVPTLMFFKNGEKIDQLVGAHPKNAIEKLLEQHI